MIKRGVRCDKGGRKLDVRRREGAKGEKLFLKRWVFNFWRKAGNDLIVRISGGSLFHSVGAAMLNAFEPARLLEKDFGTESLQPRVWGLGERSARRSYTNIIH